jgi:Tol biopolymer transport system component
MRTAAVAMALASLVTVPQSEGQRSNLNAPYVSVSGDGRFVALASKSRLVAADANDRRDVYVLDRDSGSVSLESPAPGESDSTEDCSHPMLSRDGRVLVYEQGDQVVLRDRIDGITQVLAAGREPAISADGRAVAFTSPVGVMVFDRVTQTLHNVSVDPSGSAVPNASSAPRLSGDGRYVVFTSMAALTGAADHPQTDGHGRRPPRSQVYLRDLKAGVTRLLSAAMRGEPADGDSWSPEITEDGCAVAFVSAATNLVKGDRNRSADVFLLTLANGSIELISRNAKGNSGNGASGRPALSVDGQRVAFQSEASDLAEPGTDINLLWDVFLLDRRAGRLTRLSTDQGSGWMEPSGGPAMDESGHVVAFSSRHPMSATDTRNDFDLFVLAGLQ